MNNPDSEQRDDKEGEYEDLLDSTSIGNQFNQETLHADSIDSQDSHGNKEGTGVGIAESSNIEIQSNGDGSYEGIHMLPIKMMMITYMKVNRYIKYHFMTNISNLNIITKRINIYICKMQCNNGILS